MTDQPPRSPIFIPGYFDGREPANKGKTYPAEILTPEEIKALFAQISSTGWIGLRNRAALIVMYRAGLRHAETLDLLPHDVDTVGGIIHVLHGKGDKRRSVGIDPVACRVIDEWSDRRAAMQFDPQGPLFCTRYGTRMQVSSLRMVLPRLAKQAGITKRVHPHGLRHTHAYYRPCSILRRLSTPSVDVSGPRQDRLMMEGVEMPGQHSFVSLPLSLLSCVARAKEH